MRKKQKLLPLLLSLALLAGCGAPAGKSEPVDFGAIQGHLNTRRQSIPRWTDGEKALLNQPDPDPALLTDEEVVALITPTEYVQSVLPEETAADVDLLFRALKSAYGAYDYLGGDGVFLPVKEAILEDLADRPPLTGDSVGRILARHLAPVVRDAHFAVDGQPLLTRREKMYYVPDLYFGPKEAEPAPYIRPTIAPNGAVRYCFAALSVDGADLPETATVQGREQKLNWTEAPNLSAPASPAYERRTVQGVPVLVSRVLSADVDPEGVKALAASGQGWRGDARFLVDLRANGGGNAMYAMEWFRGYADSDPAVKTIFLQNCSRLFSQAARGAYADSGLFTDQVAANEGTWETAWSEGGQVPNASTVFILTDGGTASAAEEFVKYLSSLENAVRVGSNTMGCCMTGNLMDLYLPKSGVRVRFGSSLDLYDGTGNTDGRGLLPDLWVPPQEAEAAVLRLISHYGLK